MKALMWIGCATISLLMLGGRGQTNDSLVLRLQSLSPKNPAGYFELGEEIADRAESTEDRQLAIRLFTIAGHLDPPRWQRSGLLAIDSLVGDPSTRRLLQANLRGLGEPQNYLPSGQSSAGPNDEAEQAAAEALSAFRRGDAGAVRRALDTPGAIDRLDRYQEMLPGNAQWFLTTAEGDQFGPGLLGDQAVTSTLEVQAELVGVARLPWSVLLQSSSREPMVVMEVRPLTEIFAIDPTLNLFRNGTWVRTGSTGR